MQISKLLSFIAVAMLVAVVFAGLATTPAAAQTDTMQFRYNAQHSGDYSSVAGSTQSNGQLKWSYTTGSGVHSSPAIVDGVVYVGSQDKNVYALDANDGHVIWSYLTDKGVSSSPAVVNGIVYVASSGPPDSQSSSGLSGKLYAINAKTGVLVWEHWYNAFTGSPTVVDGVVYVSSSGGNLWAIDANDGTDKWTYPIIGDLESSPVVSNGVVYLGNGVGSGSVVGARLYAIDIATRTEVWNASLDNYVSSSPAIVDGVVYVGCGNNLLAFDAANGQLKWTYPTGSRIVSSPAVANGVVYVGNMNFDWKVYAINTSTGDQVWSYKAGHFFRASPAYANGRVYIGSVDNKLHALDAATGTEVWNYFAGDVSSAAVVDGVVYVGGSLSVYAIGTQLTPPSNQAPIANAGPDQTAIVRSTVTLDGSGSSDPDGDTITYLWTVQPPTGSSFTLTGVKPTFVPDQLGDYHVSLVVNDGQVDSAADTATMTVKTSATAVVQRIQSLQGTISQLALDQSNFKNKNAAKTLNNDLNAVIKQVNAGKYTTAITKLQSSTLTKTDGCAKTSLPDKNDLIVKCPAQATVYGELNYIIQELQALLGS